MADEKKILVVDDDSDNRMLMGKILEHFGYGCNTVEDGESCLEYCKNNHPLLIFLDISLPNIDGIEVLKKLRTDNNTKKISVVMFSAHDMQEEAIQNGANDFLSKPFLPDDLKKIAEKYLK